MTEWMEEDDFEEPMSIFAGCDDDGNCGCEWLCDEEDDRLTCERVIRMCEERDLGGCE